MSSLYNVEPQPTAKVLLQTTAGDIELELFAKQIPLASRNFLQLCLDGYYDNTIFHRLVPKFVLQGGDPTGTGHGGESSFDDGPFEDEFHSRLKFNRRGLLGMANTGEKNDNGSQFFLTLDQTPELQGKNTMFGRVVGETIYNLMKMGDADIAEGTDRPLYPQKITGTEILVNPFDNMVKRARIAQRTAEEQKEKKKPKRKAQKALLSFGGDDGEDGMPAPATKKPKFNSKLISAGGDTQASSNSSVLPSAPRTPKPEKTQDKPMKKKPKMPSRSPTPPRTVVNLEEKPKPASRKSESPSLSPSPSPPRESALERTNAQIAALKASMKRDVGGKVEPKKKKSALEEMIPASATRGRKRRPGGGADDKFTMALLQAFKTKLEAAPGPEPVPVAPPAPTESNGASVSKSGDESKTKLDNDNDEEEARLCDLHFIVNCQSCGTWDAQGAGDAEDEDDLGWMGHALTFEKDRLGKDLEWKRKNEEELVVIDPREKAREMKEKDQDRKARDGRFERGSVKSRSEKVDRREQGRGNGR